MSNPKSVSLGEDSIQLQCNEYSPRPQDASFHTEGRLSREEGPPSVHLASHSWPQPTARPPEHAAPLLALLREPSPSGYRKRGNISRVKRKAQGPRFDPLHICIFFTNVLKETSPQPSQSGRAGSWPQPGLHPGHLCLLTVQLYSSIWCLCTSMFSSGRQRRVILSIPPDYCAD